MQYRHRPLPTALAVFPLLLTQAPAAQSSTGLSSVQGGAPFGPAIEVAGAEGTSAWLMTEEAKLLPGLPKHGANFGASVAVSGTSALIGAADDDNANGDDQAGSAYVFVRGDAGWGQTQRLEPADGDFYDRFGSSVALSGNVALVGSLYDDHQGGIHAGSAYVFVRRGGIWVEQAKLIASDAVADQRFGWSVAISEDTAVVGAPGPDYTGPGAAYVFARHGTSWIEQKKLVPGDDLIAYQVGHSVAISGDTIIVGTNGSGSAYAFVRQGTTWTKQQELNTQPGAFSFGSSVAVSGDTAVIGGDVHVASNAGAATVFVRDEAGVWSKQQKLVASEGTPPDFGRSVAVLGDMIVCGAKGGYPLGNPNENGSAYVFVRSGTTWTEQHKLVASEGTLDDRFGCAVALSLDAIVVGAVGEDVVNYGSGAAYAFETPLLRE